MLSTSFLENFHLQVITWYAGPVRVWCFREMCHMNPRVCSLEFCGTHSRWYLIWAFLATLKRVFMEVSFSVDEICRLQGVQLKVFDCLGHTPKRLLCYNMVVYYRRNEAFTEWHVSPCIRCGSEEAEARALCLITSCKGDGSEIAKDQRRCFQPRLFAHFANWVLIVLSALWDDLADWAWVSPVKVLQSWQDGTDLLKHLSWEMGSSLLRSLRGGSPGRESLFLTKF